MKKKRSPRVLIVDTKLVAYILFHAKEPDLKSFPSLITTLVSRINSLYTMFYYDKIVFAYDCGKPFKKDIFPEYKAHRAEITKKKDESEQGRLRKFNKDYEKSKDLLKLLGTVICVKGLEADDIAYALGRYLSLKQDTEVHYLTADIDWVRAITPSSKYLHTKRSIEYSYKTLPRLSKFPNSYLFLLSMICCGVKKENVPGIYRLGNNVFKTILNEVKITNNIDVDLAVIASIIDSYVQEGKYGLKLPEGFENALELFLRNKEIFYMYDLEELDPKYSKAIIEQYNTKTKLTNVVDIIDESIELDALFFPTTIDKTFYRLSD